MLIWSDLILGEDIDVESVSGNAIGISKEFECRWSYCDHTFKEEPSKEHGVAGLFIFENKALIKDVPLAGEFVRWLQGKHLEFHEFPLTGTVETGTLAVLKDLNLNQSEFRCRAFNRIEIQGNILIKHPVDAQGRNLAVREVKWYEEVKKYNFDQIPVIYDYTPLTMELIHGENIFRTHLTVEQKQRVIDNLVSSLTQLHSFVSVPTDVFSIWDTYYTKTFSRLDRIRDMVPFASEKNIRINGKLCRNPYFLKETVRKYIQCLCVDGCKDFVLIHGDCTFSNTMVDKELNVIFLDPRGYFGHTELYGDIAYDWAKLYYSIYGDYDQFNNGRFTLDIKEQEVYLEIESNGWKNMAEYYLSKIPECSPKAIRFLHALIWLSLTTYAWEDYDSICGAFYNGVFLLEEVLKELQQEEC